jgi:hypothetical protein
MWLPGHLAVAFLICLPIIVYVKDKRALALAYVSLFALLPDFFHLGMLRASSHSIIGLAVILAVVVAALALIFRPRPALLLAAVTAAFVHLLADLYVGSIWPWYPLSSEWVQIHAFDTPFDIRIEVVLSIIAVLIFAVALRPLELLRSIKKYDRRARANLIVLLLPLGAMAALQGAFYLYSSLLTGLDIFRGILLLFFILALLAVLAALAAALSPRPLQAKLKS